MNLKNEPEKEKDQKNKRVKIKSKMISFKCSPEFADLLKSFAENKGMSQSNLIEFLVRKEFANENQEQKKTAGTTNG